MTRLWLWQPVREHTGASQGHGQKARHVNIQNNFRSLHQSRYHLSLWGSQYEVIHCSHKTIHANGREWTKIARINKAIPIAIWRHCSYCGVVMQFICILGHQNHNSESEPLQCKQSQEQSGCFRELHASQLFLSLSLSLSCSMLWSV